MVSCCSPPRCEASPHHPDHEHTIPQPIHKPHLQNPYTTPTPVPHQHLLCSAPVDLGAVFCGHPEAPPDLRHVSSDQPQVARFIARTAPQPELRQAPLLKLRARARVPVMSQPSIKSSSPGGLRGIRVSTTTSSANKCLHDGGSTFKLRDQLVEEPQHCCDRVSGLCEEPLRIVC